jgi:hypothetical protein
VQGSAVIKHSVTVSSDVMLQPASFAVPYALYLGSRSNAHSANAPPLSAIMPLINPEKKNYMINNIYMLYKYSNKYLL